MFVIINPNHKIWGGNEVYNSVNDAELELKHFWCTLLSRVNFKIMSLDEYKDSLNDAELGELLSREMVIIRH